MANTSSIFGLGWSCLTQLTQPSIMVTGFRIVAEAIARRWQTPRGGLIGDPNYGYDLTDFINDDIDRADLAQMAHFAGAEAEKDERVLSCVVTLSLPASGLLTVVGKVQTSAGPFTFVVAVSQVTVTLLQVSPL